MTQIGNENPAMEALISILKSIKLAAQTVPIAEPFDINKLFPGELSLA